MPRFVSRSMVRRVLRFFFVVVTCLLVIAAIVGIVAWRKSSTPLVKVGPANTGTVDFEAYQRGEFQFPEKSWLPTDPGALGWDVNALDRAHDFAKALDTSAVIVLHRGVPIAVWGDVSHRENSQSIRKALLGGLYGLAIEDGTIDREATLESLGVDDDPPLTAEERTATVRHLLLSRSGIYHSALYEAGGWKRHKPERSSAAPGKEWYYNNWGFNALATIYEQETGVDIGEAFHKHLAEPVGMEDFRPRDVVYLRRDDLSEKIQGNASDHSAYIFMISARDLARFGMLYLTDGVWRDRQVLPPGWANESTYGSALPTNWRDRLYGYLWWVDPPRDAVPFDTFVTSGGRGHKLTVIPALDLVVVHRIPTGGSGLPSQLFRRFVWHPAVEDRDHDTMVEMILQAYPDLPPSVSKLNLESEDPGSPASAGADDDIRPEQPQSSF